MTRVAIVDYGMGNVHSVRRAVCAAAPHATVVITADVAQLKAADRIILPGQGAMAGCMSNLARTGLTEVLHTLSRQKPMMGVCVGMQMLFSHSEEGLEGSPTQGLAWLPGQVWRFPQRAGLKVPQIGWNQVAWQQPEHPMCQGIASQSWFYFVHSYYVQALQQGDIFATSEYGLGFTSAVCRDNLFACQFHPEKSATVGLQMYRNFVQWQP